MARIRLRIGFSVLLAMFLLQCSLFQPGDATVELPAGADQVTGSESDEQLPTEIPVATAAAPVAPSPQSGAAGHPPTITFVNVPPVIPATGEKVPVTITFTDAGQDVVAVKFKVISATCCVSDSILDVTTRTMWLNGGGVITFEVSCDVPQQVTLSATLRGFEMQEGNSYPFSYTCQ